MLSPDATTLQDGGHLASPVDGDATQDRPSAAEPDAIPPVEAIAIPPVQAPDIRVPEITADTEQAGWP
jgi:hypothetical protein